MQLETKRTQIPQYTGLGDDDQSNGNGTKIMPYFIVCMKVIFKPFDIRRLSSFLSVLSRSLSLLRGPILFEKKTKTSEIIVAVLCF